MDNFMTANGNKAYIDYKKKFAPNHWGRLPQLEIPYAVLGEGVLSLAPAELAAYIVLLEANKSSKQDRTYAVVTITHGEIADQTGYSRPKVVEALEGLKTKGFIHIDTADKFSSKTYTLMDPDGGALLEAKGDTNVMDASRVQYFTMPRRVAKDSLALLKGSQLSVYVSVCYVAHVHWQRVKHKSAQDREEINLTLSDLMTLSGHDRRTARKAIGALNLISYDDSTGALILVNPSSGEQLPMHSDEPAAEKSTNPRGWLFDVNALPSEEKKRVLAQYGLTFTGRKRGDELEAHCPFPGHKNDDRKASLSVNFEKGPGLYKCFVCGGGWWVNLACQLLGGVNEHRAIWHIGKTLGLITGDYDDSKPQPDKNDSIAEAIYDYLGENGELIKQVLRLPGKEFKQRRPGANGRWTYNVKGVRPTLYNLHLIKSADSIVLCEGEKDCETITSLRLPGVVATTSGGAGSWSDELADHLIGKYVTILSDADEAGEQFREAIEASLKARAIVHGAMRFEGDEGEGIKDVSDYLAKGATREQISDELGEWL
jgi:5S rRNA maturation endonuclease (ribonuclease M5)